MAANNNLSDFLTSVADALRSKGGTDQPINAQDFPDVIANLPSGGGEYHGLTWGAMQTEPFAWNDTMKAEVGDFDALGKSFSNILQQSKLTGKLDLSNLHTFKTGNAFINCSGITEIDMSNLASISNMNYAFQYCGKLSKVDLSSLVSISLSGTTKAFASCKIDMLIVHPEAISSTNVQFNVLKSGMTLYAIRLTAEAVDDVHLSNGNYILLDTASILDVLQHLSTTTTELTCEFHATTIAADDANHDAIAALVASLTNWTITGLTIA